MAKGEPPPHWPPTGHPLATHWPQRGGAGAPSPGPPPTDHLRTHSPHRPIEAFGRDGQKQGSPPYTDLLTGHLLATYGQRGHTTHWPPTGHLRPTWPSEAFGHLLPLPPPADRGLRTGGLPTPTDWPLTGYARPSPTPQTFGERWPKGRGGVFACKGRMATGGRALRLPLGDPLRPTPPTGWPKGGGTGHLWPKGWG